MILLFLKKHLPAIILIALAAGVLVLFHHNAWQGGRNEANAEWEQRWRDEQLKAEQDRRAEDQRRQDEINQIQADAQARIADIAATAAGTASASERMLKQARALAAAGTCNSTATSGSQTAAAASLVLVDVLRRSDQRNRDLAEAYDRARSAGLACQLSYESLRKSK